jgi:hypothetical protein
MLICVPGRREEGGGDGEREGERARGRDGERARGREGERARLRDCAIKGHMILMIA